MALMEAILAAGCFWGVEQAFRDTPGVTATEVGYTGGHTENPTYEQVCSDRTGHAEAVRVTFDPDTVTYKELLGIFWRIHDPTQKNRQGWDIGSQYRSAIFVKDAEQRAIAEKSRAETQERFSTPIVTEIADASTFWPAEDYHQQYLEKRGRTSRLSGGGG